MADEKTTIAVELRLELDEVAGLDVMMADRGIKKRASFLRVILREEWKRFARETAAENATDGGK